MPNSRKNLLRTTLKASLLPC